MSDGVCPCWGILLQRLNYISEHDSYTQEESIGGYDLLNCMTVAELFFRMVSSYTIRKPKNFVEDDILNLKLILTNLCLCVCPSVIPGLRSVVPTVLRRNLPYLAQMVTESLCRMQWLISSKSWGHLQWKLPRYCTCCHIGYVTSTLQDGLLSCLAQMITHVSRVMTLDNAVLYAEHSRCASVNNHTGIVSFYCSGIIDECRSTNAVTTKSLLQSFSSQNKAQCEPKPKTNHPIRIFRGKTLLISLKSLTQSVPIRTGKI